MENIKEKIQKLLNLATSDNEQEDLTFSERVDELIDPEMDINKVINLIQDASSLDYTKGETYNLIEKFKEDFNSKYMIVKKIN